MSVIQDIIQHGLLDPAEHSQATLPLFGQDYLAGINTAKERGLIEYTRSEYEATYGPEDDHGFLRCKDALFNRQQDRSSLEIGNARGIPEAARPLVKALKSQHQPAILELGAGAGYTSSELRSSIPHCLIDTVSLTPINPYLKPTIHRIETEWNNFEALTDGVKSSIPEHFECSPEDLQIALLYGLGMDDLVELQQQGGIRIFEPCDQPFVNKQMIGYLPDEVQLPEQRYDLILETMGPIYHNLQMAKEKTTEGEQSVAAAIGSLKLDGALFMAQTGGGTVCPELFCLHGHESALVIHCTSHEMSPLLYLGPNSTLKISLQSSHNLAPSEQMLELDDRFEFEQLIKEVLT